MLKNEHLLITKNDPKNPTNFFVKEKVLLLSSIIRQEEDSFFIIPLTQLKFEFKGENAKEVAEWISAIHNSIKNIHSKELLFSKIEDGGEVEAISSLLRSG